MRRVDLAPLRDKPPGSTQGSGAAHAHTGRPLKHPMGIDGRHTLSLRKNVMSFYDTWPAGGAESKPELLTFAERVIGRGLEGLSLRFPDETAPPKQPSDNPYAHTDDDQLAEQQIRDWNDGAVEAERLSYKLERLQVFTSSLRTLASGFKTYRPVLMWCCTEMAVFQDFLLALVEKLGRKVVATHEQVKASEAQAARAAKRFDASQAMMQDEIAALQGELEEYKSRFSVEEHIINKYKEEIAELQEVIEEKDRNAQVLLGRIRKLEKRVNDQSVQMMVAKAAKLQEEVDDHLVKNEGLRASLKAEVERHEKLKKRVELLESEEAIQGHPVFVAQQAEIARHRQALDDVRRGATTPRPRWTNYPPHLVEYDESTARTVETLVTRYLQCNNALHKTETIFSPLTRLRSTDSQKWMVGLGTDSGIPVFLRSAEKVRNTQMSKRQAEFLIRELLRERQFRREGDLGTFFTKQLQQRYNADWVVVAYNFVATLQKHLSDSDCRTFLFALFADMNEEVIHVQTRTVKQYKTLLKDGADKNGCITKETTKKLIVNATTTNVEDIMDALEQDFVDVDGEEMRYHYLFQNDEDLNESNFVEAVRKKVVDDREVFLAATEDYILEIDPVPPNGITRDGARSILLIVDPHMPVDRLDSTLDAAYGTPPTGRFALSQLELIMTFRKLLSTRHNVQNLPTSPLDSTPMIFREPSVVLNLDSPTKLPSRSPSTVSIRPETALDDSVRS